MVGTASSEISQQLVVEEDVPQLVLLVLLVTMGVAAVVLVSLVVCLGLQVQERLVKETMAGFGELTTILVEVVGVQALQARPPQARNQGVVAQA